MGCLFWQHTKDPSVASAEGSGARGQHQREHAAALAQRRSGAVARQGGVDGRRPVGGRAGHCCHDESAKTARCCTDARSWAERCATTKPRCMPPTWCIAQPFLKALPPCRAGPCCTATAAPRRRGNILSQKLYNVRDNYLDRRRDIPTLKRKGF